MRRLMLLPILLLACEHRPPAASPFVPAGQTPPAIVLHEAPLPATEALDSLLDGLNAMGAQRAVWTFLVDFLQNVDADALGQNEAARRLAAVAVVRLSHAPDFMEHFAAIRRSVDTLLSVAPDAAETRFSRAYLRWILIADGQGGFRLGELDARVLQDLVTDLRFVTERYPTWRGPGEFDPARMRLELSRVEAFQVAALSRRATETAP